MSLGANFILPDFDVGTHQGAFLSWGGTLFYSLVERRSLKPGEPRSAVTELVQGIWETKPEVARMLLRTRIHATDAPGPMERGMIRVSAKRMTGGLARHELARILMKEAQVESIRERIEVKAPALPEPLIPEFLAGIQLPLDPREDAGWIELARRVEMQVPRETGVPRYTLDRPVAAVLVSADGEWLGASINRNARNRSQHAELRLVRAWHQKHGRPLPRGARIYVTLKCCRMCAGMIWHAAEAPTSLQIVFDRDDPGPSAKGSVLERGSAERLLTARDLHEEQAQIERAFVPTRVPPSTDQ